MERKTHVLVMRFYRRLLRFSYNEYVTNEKVRNRIKDATRKHAVHLIIVKKPKLRWCGYISRAPGMLGVEDRGLDGKTA